MAIEQIVNVETANYLNAILLALFSFPLIVCPYEFMRGGKYQGAWFRGLRKSRRACVTVQACWRGSRDRRGYG